jgi:sigma-B regulation protein RsbU (phosphoserine phosphatase)
MVPAPAAHDIVDDAPCGLLATAEGGTFLRVNRTFCAWVGYPADELIGQRRLPDLLAVGSRIFHHTHWVPLLQLQGSISEIKLEVRRRDGEILPMVLNAVRREQDGGYVHEIAAYVARDRDRYEQELLHSRRRLEELVAEANELHDAARDRAELAEQMIGIVSHDLRNPLSAIGVASELLLGSELPARSRALIERIARSTERASNLINDLLDFTQARLGRGIALMRSTIDLHDVVAEALDELRLTHPTCALVHVRAGAGPCVADPGRLTQVVGNLVSNAVAYGDPASPITISSTVADRCSIAVHNTGAPIPDAVQATLFAAMTRGDRGPAGPARSVGLGLYIVREIARGHGGTATVTSSADHGTRFEVSWPAR